jgi:hypothetical protein
MAKQSIDFRRIVLAGFLTMGAGIALVVLSTILQLLSLAISDGNEELIDTIYSAYLLLLYPVFFGLYFWTGMRAVKRFGFDAVGAATVVTLSHVVVGLVKLVLNLLLAIIVVSRPFEGGGVGSTEAAVAASLFGGAVGLSGVGLSAVCGIGLLLIGASINFVVGGFGALYALRRSAAADR